MTMPQGPSGLDSGAWGAEWVTTNDASGLHVRDEASVRARLRQDALGVGKPLHPWIDAFNNFNVTINSLINGLSDLITRLFNSAGNFIAAVGTAVVDAVGGTIRHVIDFLTHVFRRGKPGVNVVSDRTVGELVDAASVVTEKTYVAVDSTETLTSFWNEPRQLPGWVGAQTDDVSYPHYLINNSAATVDNSGTVSTQSRLILIPVVAGQNREYDTIKFGVTSMTATSLYVGLYDVDESTGAATKVVDLGDVKSQYNSAVTIQSFQMPDTKTVQKGEVYYIAVLAFGGSVTLSYSSTLSGTQLVNYGRWPRFLCSYVSTGTYSVLPSSFSDSLVSSSPSLRPFWGALGVYAPTVVPAKLKLYDSFDRPDTSASRTALGSGWSKRYGTGLRVSSNAAVADSTTGTSISSYISRLNWLDQRVQATFTRGSVYSTSAMILMLRGDGNGKFMFLRVQQRRGSLLEQTILSAQMYSASSYSLGSDFMGTAATARGSSYSNNVGFTGPVSNVWTFEAIGNQYNAYLDGSLVLGWTDTSSSAFPVTDSFKEVGIGGMYVSPWNGPTISIIDSWSAVDV